MPSYAEIRELREEALKKRCYNATNKFKLDEIVSVKSQETYGIIINIGYNRGKYYYAATIHYAEGFACITVEEEDLDKVDLIDLENGFFRVEKVSSINIHLFEKDNEIHYPAWTSYYHEKLFHEANEKADGDCVVHYNIRTSKQVVRIFSKTKDEKEFNKRWKIRRYWSRQYKIGETLTPSDIEMARRRAATIDFMEFKNVTTINQTNYRRYKKSNNKSKRINYS